MTIELTMLAFSIVLGLVQLVLAAQAKNRQHGYVWATGPRDEPRPPLAGIPGRLTARSSTSKRPFRSSPQPC